jgi:tetratricopeptide (TPR) repeat protein
MSISFLFSCGSSKDMSVSEPVTSGQNEEASTQTESSNKSSNDEVDLEKGRRDSLMQVYKEELHKDYQTKANRITTLYILSQQKFYSGEYQDAMFLINRALQVKETADLLALKGSIYLGLGSIENFVAFWRRALEMDEDLPIPPSPAIVDELKRQGLIE